MKTYLLGRAALYFLMLFVPGMLLGQFTVSGTVVDDATDEPLIFANVFVADNPSVGTNTDIDGTFSLEVPEGTTQLKVSYTGYADQVVDVSGAAVIEIRLSSGIELEKILVIGYTTQ